MHEQILVADVVFDARTAGAQSAYTYSADPDVRPGQARWAPLGPRRTVGFVVEVRRVSPEDLGFDAKALKPLGNAVDGLDVPAATLDLVREASRQTLSPLAVCLSLAVPPGARERIVRIWRATEEDKPTGLSLPQREALAAAREGDLIERKGRPLRQGAKSALRALERRGLVRMESTLLPLSEARLASGLLKLTDDSTAVQKFLAEQGKNRPAQAVTLMRLQGSEGAGFSAREIKSLAQVSDATIKALLNSGLLVNHEASPGLFQEPVRP